jgi:hypothetical protein
MIDDLKSHLTHRPDCSPRKRSSLCACQKLKAQRKRSNSTWKGLGYESEEAYMEWIRRISSRDMPFLRSRTPGGHKLAR